MYLNPFANDVKQINLKLGCWHESIVLWTNEQGI